MKLRLKNSHFETLLETNHLINTHEHTLHTHTIIKYIITYIYAQTEWSSNKQVPRNHSLKPEGEVGGIGLRFIGTLTTYIV